MKRHLLIFGLIIQLTACELFEIKENKAIEICKKAKVQFDATNIWGYLGFSLAGLNSDATWLDFANVIAKEEPNFKLDWTASKTDEEGVYLVSFSDERGWGHKWEVTLDQQIVRHINANEYLSRKYGLSRLDRERKFIITSITTDTLKLERKYRNYSSDKSMDLVYIMKGSVINNTDKTLTKAEINGQLQLIFKDKTIESSEEWDSGFKRKVTKSKPWKPKEKIDFYIKTKNIEEVYLQYEPEYIFFNVNLIVEDPVGYNYDKAIEEYDLKDKWKKLSDPSFMVSEPKTHAANTKSLPEKTTTKGEEKPKIDQRAIFGEVDTSGSGSQLAQGSAQRSSTTKGGKGKPTGTMDGRVIMGSGSGKGVTGYSSENNLELEGWDFASRPSINDKVSTRNGRIVFKITVDDNGRIVQAIPDTYNVSDEVLTYYRTVVNQINFRRQGGVATADYSTGKITFIIKVD